MSEKDWKTMWIEELCISNKLKMGQTYKTTLNFENSKLTRRIFKKIFFSYVFVSSQQNQTARIEEWHVRRKKTFIVLQNGKAAFYAYVTRETLVSYADWSNYILSQNNRINWRWSGLYTQTENKCLPHALNQKRNTLAHYVRKWKEEKKRKDKKRKKMFSEYNNVVDDKKQTKKYAKH